MTVILVTGYKSFELGIFQEKDQRIEIIKKAIRHDLIRYFDEGVDWLIFMGNLGFEYWALQVANELPEESDFSIATIFTFENPGHNWNEANQVKLSEFKQVDFVKYSYKEYENSSQFRAYNQFLVDNTDGAYLFYDPENETNLKYLVEVMREKGNYPIQYLTFDRLNEFLEDW